MQCKVHIQSNQARGLESDFASFSIRRNISLATNDNSEGDESLRIDKNIQQPNDITDTQEPTIRQPTNMMHDASHHVFDILNASFNGVLMLVVWFGLLVLDEIHMKNIFYGKQSFRFGIIGFETLHSAIITNKIQQSGWEIPFR